MRVEPNLVSPDAFYDGLIKMHEGLDTHAHARLDLRLILLLANQIGDPVVLEDCLLAAQGTERDPAPDVQS